MCYIWCIDKQFWTRLLWCQMNDVINTFGKHLIDINSMNEFCINNIVNC